MALFGAKLIGVTGIVLCRVMYGRQERGMQGLVGRPAGKRPLGRSGIDGRVISN
jgi:hypothetical protein